MGDSFHTIVTSYRMGQSTVQQIVRDVAQAVWDVLAEEMMSQIRNRHQWIAISKRFEEQWQFPHCCGALDGKHCIIQCPPKSGSLYYNYKKSFSLVLLALVDSMCKFIMIDIGAAGTKGNSNCFHNSAFGQQFMSDNIPWLALDVIRGSTMKAPYVLIGYEAFSGLVNLLKPYPKCTKQVSKKTRAIFNYRLSHARMAVESTFGILASRFRFLYCRLILSPDMATTLVKAACVLHNFPKKMTQL